MPRLLGPHIQETTQTEGTGTLTLDGIDLSSGQPFFHQAFNQYFFNNDQCFYAIQWGPYWEYGIGTLHTGSPDTLSRDLCIASSIGELKLSLGVGSKIVYCDVTPEGISAIGAITFPDGDTSPTVKTSNVFVCTNTAPTTITTFDDAYIGKHIVIVISNANTTFQAGANLKHPSAANITPNANDVLSYVCFSTAICHLVKWSQNA